jgi:hypothetical protein
MSAQANPARDVAQPRPVHGTLKLLPGVWYWTARQSDRIAVRLMFVPRNKVEVDVWWNPSGPRPDVQLVFGLYQDSVEFGALTGNGFDAPAFHRLGFGTFAVNIAVQALQAVCPAKMRVQGVLSNTAEEQLPTAQRLRLEENRRAFWRRFGLDVSTIGDPPEDYLQGTVGTLHTVSSGLLAGQFPRCVPLSGFVGEKPAGR